MFQAAHASSALHGTVIVYSHRQAAAGRVSTMTLNPGRAPPEQAAHHPTRPRRPAEFPWPAAGRMTKPARPNQGRPRLGVVEESRAQEVGPGGARGGGQQLSHGQLPYVESLILHPTSWVSAAKGGSGGNAVNRRTKGSQQHMRLEQREVKQELQAS